MLGPVQPYVLPQPVRVRFGTRVDMGPRPASAGEEIAALRYLTREESGRLCKLLAQVVDGTLTPQIFLRKTGRIDPARVPIFDRILFQPPEVEVHEGIYVVRDDKVPGGTKSRILLPLFAQQEELVYASSTWGGAQVALAAMAKLTGRRAKIFVPERKVPHPRTQTAIHLGGKCADVTPVSNGYLNVLQSKAKRYVESKPKAYYLELGGQSDDAQAIIARTAQQVEKQYGPFDEVWSVAASGVLTRGLQAGMPEAKTRFYAVQVGMDVKTPEKAKILKYPKAMEQALNMETPFPSCAHYDKKGWHLCQERHGKGKVLFWNVYGDS